MCVPGLKPEDKEDNMAHPLGNVRDPLLKVFDASSGKDLPGLLVEERSLGSLSLTYRYLTPNLTNGTSSVIDAARVELLML